MHTNDYQFHDKNGSEPLEDKYNRNFFICSKNKKF